MVIYDMVGVCRFSPSSVPRHWCPDTEKDDL